MADFVPRHPSYCPTDLEAATKVIINLHNSSLAVISRGEDADNVAFQTAKACIFDLADICSTASASSAIRGICSTIFQHVLFFFITSFDGKGMFQIVDNDIWKMQDSEEVFSELNKKISDEDESLLVKLSKFRALSLLWIFFRCPKNLLSACFELFRSSATEEADNGLYFLRQATEKLDNLDVNSGIDKIACTGSLGTSTIGSVLNGETPGSNSGNVVEDASPVLKSSLLGLVILYNYYTYQINLMELSCLLVSNFLPDTKAMVIYPLVYESFLPLYWKILLIFVYCSFLVASHILLCRFLVKIHH